MTRSVGKYRVHVVTDDPPIHYENSYTLVNAKAFARIGTQRRKDGSQSEDRAVTRGLRGPVIRVYSDGVRSWPTTAAQVNALTGMDALTKNEIPRRLGERPTKVVKRGGYWRVEVG